MKRTKVLSMLLALTFLLFFLAQGVTAAADPEAEDFEVGVSEADDIVSTKPVDKVILVVSFGTSFNQSRAADIGGIEAAIAAAYPEYQVRRAFTSQIIIDKLDRRDGLRIDNVTDAMNRLVLDKAKEVIVQPTTILNGFEYDDLVSEISAFTGRFDSLKLGKFLLAGDDDFDNVAETLVAETAALRGDGKAIVYMGHGTEHEANAIYAKLQGVLESKGYDDYVIGTVEHEPSIEDVIAKLGEMNVTAVVLRPLMIVAGDHANNDMAGDEEDSWKTQLEAAGYTVETVVEGLGRVAAVQELFNQHVRDAIDGEAFSPAAGAAPAAAGPSGISASRLADGTYEIDVETDSAMFKIVACELTVADGGATATVTMSGQGFGKLYVGKADAAAADEAGQIDHVEAGEQHAFTVPVAVLDSDVALAAFGIKSGNWYDHVVRFKSDRLPAEAIPARTIDVALEGGTGRASVESPAELFYRDGRDVARIVWSSPNYTYMLVDGEKYLPVNTDGNSTFEIPVVLDQAMPVVANTVAMSSPKEIDYTLTFDSASIK